MPIAHDKVHVERRTDAGASPACRRGQRSTIGSVAEAALSWESSVACPRSAVNGCASASDSFEQTRDRKSESGQDSLALEHLGLGNNLR